MKKTILNWRVVCVMLAIALSACQSSGPAPEHKYYRLLTPQTDAIQQSVHLSDALGVQPLRADGLYSERSIVFTDEQKRQLQPYYYHHWLYEPGRLVQEHLAERLRQAGIAPAVRLEEYGGEAPYAVSGRIARFEKTGTGAQAKASVTLDLRLEKKGKLLWQKTYAADEAVSDANMQEFTVAMEVALSRIYGEFVADIGKLKLD